MKLSDKLLQESPDRLYTPDGVFKFEDPGAIAFGFLNGNIVASEFTEWGDKTGTHRDICNEHGVDPSDITPQGRFWEFEDPQTSEYRFYLAWWQDPNLEQIQQVIDYFNIDEDNLWIQYAGFSGVDKYVPETEVTDADRALLRDLSDEDMEDLRQQHLDAQAKARARKKGVGKFGAAATADRAAKAGYDIAKKAGYPNVAQYRADRYGEAIEFLQLFEKAPLEPKYSDFPDIDNPDIQPHHEQPQRMQFSDEFKHWFGRSKVTVKTPDGPLPMPVYRGTKKNPKDGQFRTQHFRETPSFTPVPEIASLYAFDHGMFGGIELKKGTVGAYFLKMENPFDMREMGLTTSMYSAVLDVFNWDFYDEPAKDTYTMNHLYALLLELASKDAEGVPFHSEIRYGLSYNQMIPSNDWDSVLDDWTVKIRREDEEERTYMIESMLEGIEIDTYALADSTEYVGALKAKGYDGIIHYDTNEAGHEYLKKAAGTDSGIAGYDDEEKVFVTYRPFEPNQIKSVWNSTFDPDNPDFRR